MENYTGKVTETREKTNFETATKLIDDLETAVNKAYKSTRLRGFVEGSITTLGIVAITGLIGLAIIKRKQ